MLSPVLRRAFTYSFIQSPCVLAGASVNLLPLLDLRRGSGDTGVGGRQPQPTDRSSGPDGS